MQVADDGAEEPSSGVNEAVLAGDLEVQIAVGAGYRVVSNGFSGSAGGEPQILRKDGG